MSEDEQIAAILASLRFDEAMICEGAWYSDTCLKRVGPKSGHKILIYGASGAIGAAAVQLAKAYGAAPNATAALTAGSITAKPAGVFLNAFSIKSRSGLREASRTNF